MLFLLESGLAEDQKNADALDEKLSSIVDEIEQTLPLNKDFEMKRTGLGLSLNMPFSRWVHLAVSYDGQTSSLYIDGTLVAQNTECTLAPSNLLVLYECIEILVSIRSRTEFFVICKKFYKQSFVIKPKLV